MNNKVYKFDEYTLLNENNFSFNNQANDPTLSSDASNRNTMDMKNSVYRLTSLIRTMIDVGAIDMGGNDTFADIDKIEEFKLLRMCKNSQMLLNVYVTFVIEDIEYWGVFEDFGGAYKYIFKSEAHNNPEFSKNFLMKLEGILMKALTKFYTPKKGMYKTITSVVVQDKYGVKHTLDVNKSVKIENVILDNSDSFIQLDAKTGRNTNETFYIKGLDYYYFNYRFTEYTVDDANS